MNGPYDASHETPDTDARLAALEASQARMTEEIARLQAELRSRKNPGIGFILRVAVGLFALWVVLQFVPALVFLAGSALYDHGGRAAVWSVVLVLAAAAACAFYVRARRAGTRRTP
ncbi:hypothetical protein [Streptomyces sp. A0958]|uniref:hypothetical protein n=1 Tax=Streptomyces sp. A0958 TaxID=2563101 RepID=UPI001444E0D6|nr:hypothetical protein [Streptomyces sp. A0958]